MRPFATGDLLQFDIAQFGFERILGILRQDEMLGVGGDFMDEQFHRDGRTEASHLFDRIAGIAKQALLVYFESLQAFSTTF